MEDLATMSHKERIAFLETCIAWLKRKRERERNYLQYRARKGTRTPTDEVGEADLVMEGHIIAILEQTLQAAKTLEGEENP